MLEAAIRVVGFKITTVLHGANMSSADQLARWWARENGVVERAFPAQWAELGKAAGPLRNSAMVREADALIAIWNGKSRGTADVIAKMKRARRPAFVYRTDLGTNEYFNASFDGEVSGPKRGARSRPSCRELDFDAPVGGAGLNGQSRAE